MIGNQASHCTCLVLMFSGVSIAMVDLSPARLEALRIAARLILPLRLSSQVVSGAQRAPLGLIPLPFAHVEGALRERAVGGAGDGVGQLHGGLRERAFDGYDDAHPMDEGGAGR
ncbi:hypothetical protein [Accumulibacter sp.]|uniref:hypothetical protein n=1 Tax=Accumulibacter sp. TaxID=2053492 RepID=UPI0035B4E0E6